jgi:hypothetical protein
MEQESGIPALQFHVFRGEYIIKYDSELPAENPARSAFSPF